MVVGPLTCPRRDIRTVAASRLTLSRSTGARALAAAAAWVSSHRCLAALFVVGTVLRIWTLVAAPTVVNDYFTGDSSRYIRWGGIYEGLFSDAWQPAGYPAFLLGLRGVLPALVVTVIVQHLLGLVAAGLMYAAARRAGASGRAALLPAGLVLLSGDHLFLEHGLLSEALYLPLLAGAAYAAVRGVVESSPAWLAVAGSVLAGSSLVRNLSLPLLVLLVVGALLAAGNRRQRLVASLAALGPAVVILLGYSSLATSAGAYAGLGEMSGWSLYARAAQFADCREFTPPPGTEGLCETIPPENRPGPYHYLWSEQAPYRGVFPGMPTEASGAVGAWARAAVLRQPMDYVQTTLTDLARYIDPRIAASRPASGLAPESMTFRPTTYDPGATAIYVERLQAKYDGVRASSGPGAAALASYSRTAKLSGVGLLLLLALTVVGAALGRGGRRGACLLIGASGVALLVLPVAVSSYEARYAVPPAMLLALSAAVGASAWSQRGRSAVICGREESPSTAPGI